MTLKNLGGAEVGVNMLQEIVFGFEISCTFITETFCKAIFVLVCQKIRNSISFHLVSFQSFIRLVRPKIITFLVFYFLHTTVLYFDFIKCNLLLRVVIILCDVLTKLTLKTVTLIS